MRNLPIFLSTGIIKANLKTGGVVILQKAKHDLLIYLFVLIILAQLAGSVYAESQYIDKKQELAHAYELFYSRNFDEASELFFSLGYQGMGERSQNYPITEPRFTYSLVEDSKVLKQYWSGTLYMDPSCRCLFYIPLFVNTSTSFELYFCGGGKGEDYLYYSGVMPYFETYHPNAIIVFCRESGYNHMEDMSRKMYEILQHIAFDYDTVVHNLSLLGSSCGAFTALKAGAYYYLHYDQPVTNICTLDTGLEWNDEEHNLTEYECDLLHMSGTKVYMFEQPGVTDDIPAIGQMYDHMVDIYIIECFEDGHSTISVNAYTYGIFSWSAGDNIILPESQYHVVRYGSLS